MKKKGLKWVLAAAALVFMMGSTSSTVFARSCHRAKTAACVKKQSRCRQRKKHKMAKYCRKTAHHGSVNVKAGKSGRTYGCYGHSRSHAHH